MHGRLLFRVVGWYGFLRLCIEPTDRAQRVEMPGRASDRENYVIKLRLRRMGSKKRPFYRIVVAEHSSPRDGRFIEIVGHYNPLTEPATVFVKEERARYWLSVGAQPTETVAGLLKRAGVTGDAAKAEAAPAVEAQA